MEIKKIMPAYSGIGSRRTPDNVLAEMTTIATYFQDTFTLRSGGCIPGADKAFEDGVTNSNKEIFLHEKGGFGNPSPLYYVSDKALKIAEHFHPVWHILGRKARLLMGRNSYQVLGLNLDDPVKFVLCYTPDGIEDAKSRTKDSGGTAQAIAIADHLGIPVINMKNKLWQYKLDNVINKFGLSYN